ncbi:Y-family DNA polymerase [Algicella marina]|uniref:Y-family DNA polymerase n=1 Tax=Algicella marina TaxID=2683284 RepID=UPI0032AEE0A9
MAETVFAVTEDRMGRQVLTSLSAMASEAGLTAGMGVTDARAMCPDLVTRGADVARQAGFLTALCRWAGRFSPWVAIDGEAALLVDLTGCAHLFGGEAALAEELCLDCADFGLSVQIGIANTRGAAWAAARYTAGGGQSLRSGDAIDQEARATRSRAVKRRRAAVPEPQQQSVRIVPPNGTRRALGPLPVAALRLDAETTAGLARLGLRRVEDLAGLPRAALARRFGIEVMRRLDQAFGAEPEPISPQGPPLHFATRISLPEPIGLEADILAGLERLLPPLTARLEAAGRGARRLRLSATRTDHSSQTVEVGLASATHDAERIRPLLALQAGRIEAGFGIERLRLQAHVTEPLAAIQHMGHMEATGAARSRQDMPEDTALHALMDRIGARLGTEAMTRLHPADSHIPEKAGTVMAAAFSPPAPDWPLPASPRPLRLFTPEPLTGGDNHTPPRRFRWRRRAFELANAAGPERIAPEWWLDDPAWRSGVRDYWRIETVDGTRLWIFRTPDKQAWQNWYIQGTFN